MYAPQSVAQTGAIRRSRIASLVTSTGNISSRPTVRAGCTRAASSPRSPPLRHRWPRLPFRQQSLRGTVVSYDLNYRESLWKGIGGKTKARDVNRELVSDVDVLFGNEEDFSATLDIPIEGVADGLRSICRSPAMNRCCIALPKLYPNLKLIASTLRTARTATKTTGARSRCTKARSFMCRSARWKSWTVWAVAIRSPRV